MVDPTGKYTKDAAVIAFNNWVMAADQAYLRLEGSYAPLVALSTSAQNSFDVSVINQHKKLGDHQKGLSHVVVVGVKHVNVSHRLVEGCQDQTTGYWATSTGARRDKLTAKYVPAAISLVEVGNAWKVDSTLVGTFSCKGVA